MTELPQQGASSPAAHETSLVASRTKFLGFFDLSSRQGLAQVTVCFIIFHVLLWLILTSLTHRAPHWDNMEEIVWAQSFQWGYYKHPPFSTWVYIFWTSILGQHFWVTHFSSLLNVGLMLAVIWRISLLIMSPARAVMAVVISAIIFYHSIHAIISDQNTLQLLPIALMAWFLLLAVKEGGWWRWALMGVAAGICVLTKYSAVIWFAVMGLWLLQDKRMHNWSRWGYVLLAVACCALVLWPHINWLISENFPTFRYAEYQANGRGVSNHWYKLFSFLSAQAGRLLPLVLLILLVHRQLRREPRLPCDEAIDKRPEQTEWRFATILALGPLCLTVCLGIAGVSLNANWAVTFFIMTGVWAVRFLPAVDTIKLLKTVLAIGLALDIAMAAGEALTGGLIVDLMKRQARANFPSEQYATELDKIWLREMGPAIPLKLVVADEWFGGVYLVKSKWKPLIFLDGYYEETPWITKKMLHDFGALIVADRREDSPPPRANVLALLEKSNKRGAFTIPWARNGKGKPLAIEWGIIEPLPPVVCKDD
jgi:4-amino-4-deoxy-L-arabinose transferase-like glycosyltransferase